MPRPSKPVTALGSAMWGNKKRPRGVSSGRKIPMIFWYVKGARKVNPKCESELHFCQEGAALEASAVNS